jgi:hypothetical protein
VSPGKFCRSAPPASAATAIHVAKAADLLDQRAADVACRMACRLRLTWRVAKRPVYLTQKG